MQTVLPQLKKQLKLLESLFTLLQKEYQALQNNTYNTLPTIPFAMQDIIHQIEHERRTLLQEIAIPFKEYLESLSLKNQKNIKKIIENIQEQEQACKEQMEKNKRLTLGLLEQCRKQIQFIQKTLVVETSEEYLASGKIKNVTSCGNFLEGSL